MTILIVALCILVASMLLMAALDLTPTQFLALWLIGAVALYLAARDFIQRMEEPTR
jgi:hypothetical protein